MIHFALLIISFVVIAWAACIVVPIVIGVVGFVLCGIFTVCATPFFLLQEWMDKSPTPEDEAVNRHAAVDNFLYDAERTEKRRRKNQL